MTPRRPGYESPKPRFVARRREVLVCVGIVTVLGAVLAPLFQQAQDMARQVGCLGQLRARGQSVLLYAADYDNQLPRGTQWQTKSNLYIKEEKGPCPALSHPALGVLGYAMDSRLAECSLDKVGAPHERCVLLFESFNLRPNAHDRGTSFDVRHGDGTITFVDGHAHTYKQNEGDILARRGVALP